MLGAFRCQTHHRNDDIDFIGQQKRDAVGTGDLLHFEFHAKALGDHFGQFDIEADGIAVGILRAEGRGIKRHADPHNAFGYNVLQLVGFGLRRSENHCAERKKTQNNFLHHVSPFNAGFVPHSAVTQESIIFASVIFAAIHPTASSGRHQENFSTRPFADGTRFRPQVLAPTPCPHA